ncbi:MAG: ribosome maturation factor RimM [Flavobacteriales bacterium]
MEGFIEIGHIAKLHGFKGEVSLFLDVTNSDDYSDLSVVYFNMDGIPTPFHVVRVKPMNKGFLVLTFEGISSEVDARLLVRKAVFLPEVVLQELDDHSFYDHEVEGFTVFDTVRGNIGRVVGVIDHPSNPLLQIDCDGQEILIPLNLDLNKTINRTDKTLTITTPEGLLDIYLN